MERIRVNNYNICNPKIDRDITIVSISDIHSNANVLYKVYELLKTIHVDIICIPGDIIDYINCTKNKELLEVLAKICSLAKTYISLGNHDISKLDENRKEIHDEDLEFFKELESKTDCSILKEEFESINYDNKIIINGISFPLEYYKLNEDKTIFNNIINSNSSINPELYNILLSHSPNRMIVNNQIVNDGLLNDMNLILCGHNHGGLTPLFIQNKSKNHVGLVGPYARLFPKNSYGSYYNDKSSLIINNGLTKIADSSELGFISKTANKIFIPEIDIIILRNGKENILIKEKNKVYKK